MSSVWCDRTLHKMEDFSPPARWGLLDFMSVASCVLLLRPVSCVLPSACRLPPPRPLLVLLVHLRPAIHSVPCRTSITTILASVPCRTSTTSIPAECSLPDLNHDHPRPVFPAGPQPRPSPPSVPCRTSTASIPAQCSLPDLNREYPRQVFPAGPQPRLPDRSGHCRTSTGRMSEKMSDRMSEDMPDRMPDRMPERMSERMSEDMPDWMSEDMPARMSEDMPERMSEDMPDRMSEDMPDRMPEKMSEDMPDRMPEDLPDRMPEDLPDRMPEDMPDRMAYKMSEKYVKYVIYYLQSCVCGSVTAAMPVLTLRLAETFPLLYVWSQVKLMIGIVSWAKFPWQKLQTKVLSTSCFEMSWWGSLEVK